MSAVGGGGVILSRVLAGNLSVFPVNDDSRKYLEAYMKMWVEELASMPETVVPKSYGWQDDGGFQMGAIRSFGFGAEPVITKMPASMRESAGAFTSRGELKAFVDSANALYNRKGREHMQFVFLAGLGTTMLEWIKEGAPGGHLIAPWSAESATGKTTTCYAAMAHFVNPTDESMQVSGSGGATDHALTLLLAEKRNLSQLIDETTGWDANRWRDMVYRLADGTGRKQGSASGGLRANRGQTWHNIIFLTGNDPVSGKLSGEGGAGNPEGRLYRAFNIMFPRMHFNPDDREHVRALMQNSGHSGPYFISHMITHKDAVLVELEKSRVRIAKKDGRHPGGQVLGGYSGNDHRRGPPRKDAGAARLRCGRA